MDRFKVSMPGGRWKFGFETLSAARQLAELQMLKNGIVVAIIRYRSRTRKQVRASHA